MPTKVLHPLAGRPLCAQLRSGGEHDLINFQLTAIAGEELSGEFPITPGKNYALR